MKMDIDQLQSLQTRIAAGEQKAFEELYRLFAARLYSFALLYVQRKEISEEIVQDIMIKIWNKREILTSIRNLETYLFVATRNHCLNHLSTYSHSFVSLSDPQPGAEIVTMHDPARELEWKEIHFRLTQAIEELPEQCKTVFKLIKEEGFRYKQVAEILNISARTVETQLFRAIKKISSIVEVQREKNSIRQKNTDLPLIALLLILLFP